MTTLEIMQLARRQFGVVSRRQLLVDLRMSTSAIGRLTASGELGVVLPGVYELASAPASFESRSMAVQLWLDGRGFLSSWTAARLVGLRGMSSRQLVHVTVPRNVSRAAPDGVHLDRTAWYHPHTDRTTLASGLVVATPARMIWGLAADLTPSRFARAAEDAWHLGLISPAELADYLELHRCRGKDGVANIERWLDRTAGQERPAQSGLEQTVEEALRRIGLPAPVKQHPLVLRSGVTIHLDLAWPAIRLAVEPGSAWFHGGDVGMARDQERDLACVELGWQVIRVGDDVRDDPAGFARRVATAHRRRTADLAPTRNRAE